MRKYERWIIYPISITGTIIALVALFKNCPRTDGLDYIGVIVGILALLVTALIGWQIFSIVNIEKIKENVEKTFIDTFIKTEESKMELYASLCEMYIHEMEKEYSDKTSFNYVMNHLYLIITLENLGEYTRCDKSIISLLNRVNSIKPIKSTKEKITLIFKLINRASLGKSNNSALLMELTKAFIDEKNGMT